MREGEKKGFLLLLFRRKIQCQQKRDTEELIALFIFELWFPLQKGQPDIGILT